MKLDRRDVLGNPLPGRHVFTPAEQQVGARAGAAMTAARYGSEHFALMGRRGGRACAAKPGQMAAIARARWAKAKGRA